MTQSFRKSRRDHRRGARHRRCDRRAADRRRRDGVLARQERARTSARAGVTYLEADVTDPDSVAAAFARIDRDAGQIDILVNNAGIQRVGLVGKVSFADFSAVVATHLNGFFLCASQAVPRMVRRGKGGAIVSHRLDRGIRRAAGARRLLRGQGRHIGADAGAGAGSRQCRNPGQRRGAGVHAHQVHRAGTGRRLAAGGLDGGAGADAPSRPHRGDRQRRPLPGRRRKLLHDRADAGSRRRLDRPGHSRCAGLAADAGGAGSRHPFRPAAPCRIARG